MRDGSLPFSMLLRPLASSGAPARAALASSGTPARVAPRFVQRSRSGCRSLPFAALFRSAAEETGGVFRYFSPYRFDARIIPNSASRNLLKTPFNSIGPSRPSSGLGGASCPQALGRMKHGQTRGTGYAARQDQADIIQRHQAHEQKELKRQIPKDIVSGIMVAVVALPLSIALGIASGVGP